MPLWICLHLPEHSLDASIPGWRGNAPLAATLCKDRVHTCSAQARRLGVRPGLRLGTTLALAPGIVLADDDPGARDAFLRRIALGLQQYTPNIAIRGEHALVLDVGASLALFHGPRALWRAFLCSANLLAPGFSAGMAPTSEGALLLALREPPGRRRALCLETLLRLLDALPVGVLPAARPYLDWLEGIGCITLAQLRKLPRKGLRQRAGPELPDSLDAAYGRLQTHHAWLETPDLFSLRIDTDRLEHLHAIQAAATQLVDQLCGWLRARNAAAQALEFRFFHEKGRNAAPPTVLAIELAHPRWHSGEFKDLLIEHLRRMPPMPSIIGLALTIPRLGTRPSPEAGLFPELNPAHTAEQQLLDLLCARLGAGQVRRAHPLAHHLPEKANAWVPVTTQNTEAPHPASVFASDARPFWLLTAIPLNTHNDRPVYKGAALRLLRGPERLASDWWSDSGHEQRDYFVAQDAHAVRYWVYRRHDPSGGRWFLHGLYG
ncbi:MAG TPA: DNA polymerase Y family protein [Burkholderiaceae bacterium]|nr:DNA polymerase Y family protein [Burkholderiaceae bacterium]